jgi:tetratricopeptide (TPR) repeat protein
MLYNVLLCLQISQASNLQPFQERTLELMWVSDSYEDIYAHAQSSLAKGDYQDAYDEFHRLSERLSSLKPAVLARRPGLLDLLQLSLVQEGEIHRIQGEFEQALQLYQRLIEIAPEGRDSWQRSMALVRIDMGQSEAGLDELRAQAVAHSGDFRLWLTIGLECEALGRLDEAEENLQRAVKSAVEPDDKNNAYLAVFDFYRAQGRVDEALDAWQKAWEAHGHTADYVFPLYQMMWENGEMEQAHKYLRQEKNQLRKRFHQGLLAASEGKPDEAIKHWKRLANMDPMAFDAGHEAWAEGALRADHPPEQVISTMGALIESGNFTLHGLVLQAVAEARIGHLDHAQKALEFARTAGQRTRPRQDKLSAANWELFDELVANAEMKGQLRDYFQADQNGEVEGP